MKKRTSSHRPHAQNVSQEIRRFGVIIEHVDDNVKLVAEQYGDIKKTLDEHTKTFAVHTEMIGELAVDMNVIKVDMSIMKKDIEIMKTDIEFIKHGFKKKVDIDEFAALERRVILLEKRR